MGELKHSIVNPLISIISLCLQNREMHDHMEYFLAGQDLPPHRPTENKPEVVYRWGATFHFCYMPYAFVFPWMIKSMKQEQIMYYSALLLQQTAHTDDSDQQGSSLH